MCVSPIRTHLDAAETDVSVYVKASPACNQVADAYAKSCSPCGNFCFESAPGRVDFGSRQYPIPANGDAKQAFARKRHQVSRYAEPVFQEQGHALDGVAVVVGAVLAVGEHHRFIVVDKRETGANEVVRENLVLDSRRNRKAEVHFLEVLLGDTQRFAFGQGVLPKAVIECVDGVLEVFAFGKIQERDGGLQKNR